MSTLTTDAAGVDDPEVSPEDLIPLREQTWQRYRQHNQLAELAALEAEDQAVAAMAFGAGYMACYGEFRELILAALAAQG